MSGSRETSVARLYKAVAPATDNTFFSPFSIHVALAMVASGARGETLNEILAALNLGAGEFESVIQKEIESANSGTTYSLSVANKAYARHGLTILDEYISLLKSVYKTSIDLLDFAADADGARQVINNWVAEQTNDKIQDLLPGGFLNSQTALVLVNAVYFKGDWKRKFDAVDTVNEPFHVSEDTSVAADFMRQTKEFAVTVLSDQHCLILELPYGYDSGVSMFIILPDTIGGITSVEENLLSILPLLKHSEQKRKVRLALPKFKLRQTVDLVPALTSLGVGRVFSSVDADLSGVNGQRDLHVSQAIHQAYIDVNEQGSEAAAATAFAMMLTCARGDYEEPLVVRCDRPFVFGIKHNASDAMLFMGRLASPV